MTLYKTSLLSLPPLSLSAFHFGGIFKCPLFFGCSLIFKSGTQKLYVPSCIYLRMGFIKIDGSILYIPQKKRIYSGAIQLLQRIIFESLFWKHSGNGKGLENWGYHSLLRKFSLNLPMGCPVAISFCAENLWCKFHRE